MQCPIIFIHKQGCQNLMKLAINIVHKALLQEIEYFLIWASTSGFRAPKLPTVYKANSYVILHIFICLSFQKCIINDTFAVYYLKFYSCNVRNGFL